MTIPVVPGPWSFLQNVGQGIANYAGGKEQFRQTRRREGQEDRTEAFQKLGFLFEGIQEGSIDAKVVKSPLFLDLLQKSGLGEAGLTEAAVPNPAATIRRAGASAADTITGRVLGRGDEEELTSLAGGKLLAPSERATARETTARGNVRAQTIEQGGAAGRQAAGILDENTAAALETAASDPVYYQAAQRSVDATLTTLKIPEINTQNMDALRAHAWQLAQEDARTRGVVLNEQLTRPYIDAAIQQRFQQQELEKLRAETARLRASGGLDQDALIRIQQRNAEIYARALESLPKPDEAAIILAGDYEQKLAQVGSDPMAQARLQREDPLGFAKYHELKNYYERRGRLTELMQGALDETQGVLGQTIPVTTGSPTTPVNKMSSAQINAAARQYTDGTLTEAHLKEFLDNGRISDLDAEQIRSLSRRSTQQRGR